MMSVNVVFSLGVYFTKYIGTIMRHQPSIGGNVGEMSCIM